MSSHFEIHVEDIGRAKAFYAGLFGWSFHAMQGAEDVGYHLIDGNHFNSSENLSGGIMLRVGQKPEGGSPIRGGTMTFQVDDCDASYAWALANGGGEALSPEDYPEVGRCAYVEDGEGNIVGMISQDKEEN